MDAWGHATQVHEANGVTITRGYSQVTGLAQNLTAAKGDITVAQYTYEFDGYGNLTTRTDGFHGATESEHYDDLNRLTKSILTLAGGGGGTTTYGYDDAGNLTSRSDRGTYTYGENGAGPHAVTSISDGSTFSYNENGDMMSDGARTLAWQDFGQVASITQGATTVSLDYDAENQRYRKTVSGATEETVQYLGAAERLTVNGQDSIRRTLALADLTIVDTGGANAQLRFVVTDHLGSAIALVKGNAAAQSLSYGPFGERMTAGWAAPMSVSQALTINTTESDRGYTGQEGLDAVGLWDYNARLYDPALGRFLSVDPLIAHPESTQGLNPYSYVENNPLNKTDPTGMADSTTCVGTGDNRQCTSTKTVTNTPTGSHIPQSTRVSTTTIGGKVTGVSTSGAGALPGGRIASTVDGNSSWTISANAVHGTNVSAHNFGSGQADATGGGFLSSVAAAAHNFGCGFSGNCSVMSPGYSEGGAFAAGGAIAAFLGGANEASKYAVFALSMVVPGGAEARLADATLEEAAGAVEEGGLNLFKWGDATSTRATGWREGDYFLNLPDLGSPKANWIQNASRLREEMNKGKPIFDSYRDPVTGERIPAGLTPTSSGRFIRAERDMLENRNWQYDPKTGAYRPPP